MLRLAIALFLIALVAAIATNRATADSPWYSGWPEGQPSNQVTALAVASSDSRVAYASTPAAIYRTGDEGANWTLVSALPNTTTMAADPSNADTVYAYFWPKDSSTPQYYKGLRKSADGGKTWTDPSGGTSADIIGQATTLALDPFQPGTMLVGTAYQSRPGQILRSADGGATWQATYTITSVMGVGDVTSIAFHPTARNVIYAGHNVYHGGVVIRSDDDGVSWQLSAVPMGLSFPSSLALDPGSPNLAYVAAAAPMGAGIDLFRTGDGGVSWQEVNAGLPSAGASLPQLAINPSDPRVLFLSVRGDSSGIYQSVTRGNTWSKLSPDNASQFAFINALAYGASSRILYAATNEGMWRSRISPAIAYQFSAYYDSHDGPRVLGSPISLPLTGPTGRAEQYFEKGRLEDHGQESSDPNWQYMYGLLTDELQSAGVNLPVGGEASTITYSDLHVLAGKDQRIAPPDGFTGGVQQQPDSMVFVPFTSNLQPDSGHKVLGIFWYYINNADLFPAGWLHDIGLPTSEAVEATVDKGDVKGRKIWVQAFQRTILTYDPQNPPDYQIERANVGTDYVKAFPDRAKP